MSQLKVRKIPFEFEKVAFIWNPANPHFSVSMNLVTLYATPLERFMVKTVVEAEALIKDPGVRETAKLFRMQEGQHAKCHLAHLASLIKSYPGLQQTADRLNALMDHLLEKENLQYRLAFMATLETSFTPLFKMIIDNRRDLFSQGDCRVASLMLWHFSEEVEHRSAAVEIYNNVFNQRWYRLRIIPSLVRFHFTMVKIVVEEFKRHVVDVPEEYMSVVRGYRSIPRLHLFAMFYRLSLAALPWYNHERQPLPRWSLKWFEHYERGDDMSRFYGIKPNQKL